jgi:DNA-binding MarR family transcriptional regulator
MTAPTLNGQTLAEAQGAVRALLEDALAGAHGDISANEYVVLRVLTLRGPVALPAEFHRFLAAQRQLGLTPDQVATLLAGLQDRGLIADAAHDAPGPIRLTDAGAARHTAVARTVAELTTRVYGDLDPDELVVAQRVLTQVIQRAEQIRRTL